MAVSSAATTPTPTPPVISAANDSAVRLSQDYTTFLKMLTTQLQNQDPLAPMDSTQFTQQLVAFSSVEQQIAANKNLEALIAMQKTSSAGQMLGYLGKVIETSSTDLQLKSGIGKFSYTLPVAASALKIEILDATGNVIRTSTTASGSTGRHEITWDGGSDAGTQMADGIYKVKVTAKNSNGEDIVTTVTTYGVVDGVQTGDGSSTLYVGPMKIDLANILSIHV